MNTLPLPGTVISVAILLSTWSRSDRAFAQGCPTPSFAEASAFYGAWNISYISSVTVGDFNGDGIADLAVARLGDCQCCYCNGYVWALLGKGDGTFGGPVSHTVGNAPTSLALGDFNGDGKPDLAVADRGFQGPGSVSVLLGRGDGSFETAGIKQLGQGATSVAVGDFNSDGKADVVVAYPNNVSVLSGNGDGTFGAAANYLVRGNHYYPGSLAVGDFNGDGKPDLVVPTDDGFVSVLLGKADGTLQDAVDYSASNLGSLVVGDFNNDGKLDIATPGSVLLGKGDGTFQPALDYEAGGRPSYSVAVGDFNGDGKLDLTAANAGSYDQSRHTNINSNVSVLLGNGDGTFQTAVRYGFGTVPFLVAVGDFNSDGKPDVADIYSFTPYVALLLNTCGSSSGRLAVVRSNSVATISWPLQSTGLNLESTTDLSLANWQAAVEVPRTNNGRLEVPVPLDQAKRFFRLRKP